MAKAKLEFSADAEVVAKALDKANHELAQLKAQMVDLTAATKRQQNEAAGVFGTSIRGAEDLYARLAGTVGVVHLVTGAYADWRQEMERLAAAQRSFEKDLVRTLARSGDLARGRQIEQALENVPGVTREQARAAFEGVTGAAQELPLNQRIRLAGRVAQSAPLGADLTQLGAAAGELTGVLPGQGAGRVTDIAGKLQQLAGDELAEVGSKPFQAAVQGLVESGAATPEQALGFAIATLRANQPLKFVGNLAKKLGGQKDPRAAFQGVLGDEGFRRKFLGRDALIADQIVAAGPEALAGEIAGAEGFQAQQLAELGGSLAGRAELGRQRRAVDRQQKQRYSRFYAEERERQSEEAAEELAPLGVLGKINLGLFSAGQVLEDVFSLAPGASPGTPEAVARARVSELESGQSSNLLLNGILDELRAFNQRRNMNSPALPPSP